jgi:dihydroxyacetone kinase
VLGEKAIGRDELKALGQATVDGIQKRGKAQVSEKTMLDTLVPAVEALGKVLQKTKDSRVVVASVILAARDGIQATLGMKARYSPGQLSAQWQYRRSGCRRYRYSLFHPSDWQ